MFDEIRNHETPATIYEWSIGVFGPPRSPLSTLVRAQEEMNELLRDLIEMAGPQITACEEAADVVILLARVAGQMGVNLSWNTEWKSDGVLGSATAANLILARLIANPLPGGDTQTRQFSHDLHWIASHMARVCEFFGRELQAEVDSKMARNRARQWEMTGEGVGRHIQTPAHHLTLIDNSGTADAVREMRFRGPYGPGDTATAYASDTRADCA